MNEKIKFKTDLSMIIIPVLFKIESDIIIRICDY